MTDVLLVDDEPDVLLMASTFLRRDGVVFHEASDGPGGLSAALAVTPALVVLDHRMPGATGIEVAERLQAEGFAGRIVLFSAHLDATLHANAARLGIEAVPKTDLRRLGTILDEVRSTA